MISTLVLRILQFVDYSLLYFTQRLDHVTPVNYQLKPRSTLGFHMRFPFCRRVTLHYSKASSRDIPLIRVYPVNGVRNFSRKGNYTVIHTTSLSPPRFNLPKLPVAAASLKDTRTGQVVNVTEELIRLAGPGQDFFGFQYPFNIVSPWLCDRTGLKAEHGDLVLTICQDSSFAIHSYRHNDLLIVKN